MSNTENLKVPEIKFDKNGELVITASATSSKYDFDFLVGNHTVHHKKLKTRLANSNEWIEFEGSHKQELILLGIGNLEQQKMIANDGKPFEGTAFRLFNPKTKLWSIYWADSIEGKLDPQVVGSFENNIGYFFTKDTFNNKQIIVAFCWDARDKNNLVWSQAFSVNNGKTWEWNWFMYMTKVK